MTVLTTRGPKALIRVSLNGSGSDHYHLIMSRTTGLNGAYVMRSFETLADATAKATLVRDVHTHAGFIPREIHNRAILQLTHGETVRYLFVRHCNLRHAR